MLECGVLIYNLCNFFFELLFLIFMVILVYCDNDGKLMVLLVVVNVEKWLVEEILVKILNYEYL